MDRFLYPHPANPKYFYCDGTRSVAHTGEVLPHNNGEVMLTVVGAGRVWSGVSPLCTHAFITSAALRQSLSQHYSITGPGFLVDCGMGGTLRAMGTIRLPVYVQHGYGPSSFQTTNGPYGAPCEARGAVDRSDGKVALGGVSRRVTVDFVVVEGKARECMLDTEAFTRLGLDQHNLVRPARQPNDPAADFQEACIMSHGALGNNTEPAYYPLPKGTPPPRLTFGIGQTVVRTVKGVLVMTAQNQATGEPSLVTHQVLDGPGQNVFMQSMLPSNDGKTQLWTRAVDRVEAILDIIIGDLPQDRERRTVVAEQPVQPVQDTSYWVAVESLLTLRAGVSRGTASQGGSPSVACGLKRRRERHVYTAGSSERAGLSTSSMDMMQRDHGSVEEEERASKHRYIRTGMAVLSATSFY